MSYAVFYLNPRVTPFIEGVIRGQMPPDWKLLLPYPEGDLSAGLAGCDFILVADHPITAEHLAAAPGLRMIQHQGVGYERIDVAACAARGIPIGLTPEGTSIGVAEHTILLILALGKRLSTALESTRKGQWLQWELRETSFELCGKTLGLVGFGRIGQEVARRALAFDARVLYYDVRPALQLPAILKDASICGPAESLADLLAAADVVSLHAPLTPETRHLINAGTLARMKPGAVLINTARGGLVDEVALLDAVRSGRLAGAGLDVTDPEPPDPSNPLLAMENVLVTPHIAAGTRDALVQKMRAAFANLVRFTRGEPLRNVVL